MAVKDIHNSLVSKIGAFEGLAGIYHTSPVVRPYTADNVHRSLKEYVDDISSAGAIRGMIDSYLGDDSSLESKKFKLLVHKGDGHEFEGPQRMFYFDGDVNLMLLYGRERDEIGVSAGLKIVNNWERRNGMDITMFGAGEIMINQLQGATYSKDRLRLREVFSNFRWEQLLCGLLVSWARVAMIPTLYLQPSKFNDWPHVSGNANNTANLRYDVTAKRIGFSRTNDTHPYSIELGRAWDELYQIFLEKQ